MEFLSTILSGAFSILATALGFLLGLVSGVIAWLWKARGIRDMLADEVEVNWNAYKRWTAGTWPVRSVYIWQSLQPLVPGLLSRARVRALMDFYYLQAEIYKGREAGDTLTQWQVERLRTAAEETLKVLGRPAV